MDDNSQLKCSSARPPNASSLEKRIKKHIYGKLQTVKILFPVGFSDVALSDVQTILKNRWLPQQAASEVTLVNNAIYIRNIHMFTVTELLIRSRCITDLRLVIFQGKTLSKFVFEKKCRLIPWYFYLNQSMSVKLKVNSVASKAFHETALKKILQDVIKPEVGAIVSGDPSPETTILFAELYQDKLTLSISLAGEPLYKRGYRGILASSAPLREDAASCCLRKALQFFEKTKYPLGQPVVVIPFSGTGTFAFEYWQDYCNVAPVLFNRQYALQKMPLFRKETFCFLVKKARENCFLPRREGEEQSALKVICIDHSETANAALLENQETFQNAMEKAGIPYDRVLLDKSDFLKMDFTRCITTHSIAANTIFLPLNPPYGIRLGKEGDTVRFYKNIAKKLKMLAETARQHKGNLLGFILCPSEETWSSFLKNISPAITETYHFNQGGMDIRVCQFLIE